MGLYFGEISQLTSVPSVPGLKILFWPAVAIIGAAWVLIIVAGGMATNFALATTAGPQRKIIFAFVTAALVVQLLVVLWGSFCVVRQASGGARLSVARVALISVLASVFLTSFGIASMSLQYLDTTFMEDTISEVSLIVFFEFGFIFVPCFCVGLIILNFRVSTSKEIELSKSSTSSTSSKGGSSSSSSSSASSSRQDPVIEL